MSNKNESMNNSQEKTGTADEMRENILKNHPDFISKFAGNLDFVFDEHHNIEGVYIKGDDNIRDFKKNVPDTEVFG